MDEKALEFWKNHSIRFIEMALGEDKRESVAKPDGYGRQERECGDAIEVFLSMRDGKIRTASFQTNGCLYAVACANTVVHLVEGKSLGEAMDLNPDEVAVYLETLPESEYHCAEMAVLAMRNAVADARLIAREPWKKAYRK